MKKLIFIVFFFSFFLKAENTINYKTMSGNKISINSDNYKSYKSKYHSFLKKIMSCENYEVSFKNPAHGSYSNFKINGIKRNQCFVTFNLNSSILYNCLLNKSDIRYFSDLRREYLEDVRNIETFSKDERKVINKKNCVSKLLKEEDILNDEELDEIINNRPDLKFLLKSMETNNKY